MGKLEDDYFDDSVSSEQLRRLKKKLEVLSDEEIADVMNEKWMACVDTYGEEYRERVSGIKSKLDVRLNGDRELVVRLRTWLMVAAVLIPVLAFSTFFFYRKALGGARHDIVVSTGRGERATIVLEDGTAVKMNAESRLSYNPKSFNERKRRIVFHGEGFFTVAKNHEVPFIIRTDILRLKVLGTKFNLKSRADSPEIAVCLEEGRVQLLSDKTGSEVALVPGNRAVLNKSTGLFEVRRRVGELDLAWMRGGLDFDGVALARVLKSLESVYDVDFVIKSDHFRADELFTGTLPVNNISEVFRILEHTWGVSCRQYGREIVVRNK